MRKASVAVTAMLALPLLGSLPASATDNGVVTQITNGNNKSTVPIISGSGERIIFHSSATNLPGATKTNPNIDDVYQANISGTSATFIARSNGDGGERASFPDISANGTWAVYSSVANGGTIADIWRVNLDTNALTKVTSGNASSGSFGNLPGARVDDNGNVVFQSLATNLTAAADPDATTNDSTDEQTGWDVYYWNGSTTTKLSTSAAGATNFLNPDISANGTRIAYNSAVGETGERKVYSNNTAGTAESVIADGNGTEDLPRVSDDGAKIVMRSNSADLGGATNQNLNVLLWTSPSTLTRVTDYPVTSVTNPSISGDGRYVAFQRGGEIYRSVAASSGATIQVSKNTPAGPIDYPALSTTGRYITYAQSTDHTVPGVQLFLWDADGVTPPPGPDLSFTETGCEGYSDSIFRLYTASFNRVPEQGGFEFWMVQYTSGSPNLGWWSLQRMANHFAASDELMVKYGSLSDDGFVRQIYRNILGREGEESGVTYWTGRLTTNAPGAPKLTRGEVLLKFSESPENIANSGTSQPTLGVWNVGRSGPWTCGNWSPAK